jgi:hemerythrin
MEGFENIIFRRVDGVDYSVVRSNVYLFNVFLSMDGERSVERIAREDSYDPEYLAAVVDKMEKIGLLVPIDGGGRREVGTQKNVAFSKLPKEFLTGIGAVDEQHQRLVGMVHQLDDVRKAHYQTAREKQVAVGDVVSELIDYTISHFAFEESLMEDAGYNYYNAHKRIHELLIKRAGEYKQRWKSGEDIADELHDVLIRWLFNHIRNEDKAFAPSVKRKLVKLGKSKRNWLRRLVQRFF